jgi:alpha-D-xyloside xylohydrolase
MLLAAALAAAGLPMLQGSSPEVVVDAASTRVRLRACGDRVIRVTAWPKTAPEPSRPSLSLAGPCPSGGLTVRDESLAVVASTPQLVARVDKATGAVAFHEPDGRPLLREEPKGRLFRPVTAHGEDTLQVRQEWDVPEGQSLYGLGQHQDRLLDVRGRDLDLWQRNREIVVPVLVSSAGWGLLWDNPSYMRFGSPEDVVPVPGANLLDEAGRPGGLTAAYFADREMTQPLGPPQRGLPAAAALPDDLKDKVRGVRWTGHLVPSASGAHDLVSHWVLNDLRLWLDQKLLVDYWSLFVRATESVRVPLEANRRYALKIEWTRGDANGPFDLRWVPPRPPRPTSIWSASAQGIDYYVIQGGSLDGVVAGYRELTGRAPLLPKWAYGYWQSRERYQTQDQLLGVLKELRRRRFPVDVMVQDWRYWRDKQWGSHEFDPTRFPDPKGMVDEAHRLNARVPISVWAKFDVGTANFEELRKGGHLYRYTLDRGIKDWLGDEFTFYDAFSPEGRKVYWRQVRDALFVKGFDGWWLDANEPNLIDDPRPEEQAQIIDPTAAGPAMRVMNAWPLVHNGGFHDELRQAAPDRRVAILSRSAWAGSQRHGAIAWSGDTVGRWEVLKAQIPAGLSYSLSGLPYWSHDVGGFSVDYPGGNKNEEFRELFARWFQFGAFTPVFRAHGQTTEREPWFFGGDDHPVYKTLLDFTHLRYRLLPYVYAVAARVTLDHDTMMRALVMDFPEDTRARDVKDQYLFGPAMLVSPVLAPKARSRAVYLPAGRWYDFWTGNPIEGPTVVETPAPLEQMPLHVRAGSVLPLGPAKQHVNDGSEDPVTLLVYEGRDGAFALYEDDGETNAYEKGTYARIPLTWTQADRTLTIGARTGRFPGALAERTFEVVFVSPERRAGYGGPLAGGRKVAYRGQAVTVKP